jgi:hypothetical protein
MATTTTVGRTCRQSAARIRHRIAGPATLPSGGRVSSTRRSTSAIDRELLMTSRTAVPPRPFVYKETIDVASIGI